MEKKHISETDVEYLRFMLFETVKTTRWQIIKRHLSRDFLRELTRKIVFATLASFVIFIAPYILFIIRYHNSPSNMLNDIHAWGGLDFL